jgi:hypothetical protein
LSGKIITYEEPILVWSGDLESIPGKTAPKWSIFPRRQTFSMPDGLQLAPDLAVTLGRTIEAYHQQPSGTRFKLLTSKLGYHIVPV